MSNDFESFRSKLHAPEVLRTTEFDRIIKLPRRRWEDHTNEAFAEALTKVLRPNPMPPGPNWGLRPVVEVLKPIQAVALREMRAVGGLLAPVPVGMGKTLISALAPVILGAKKPLLVVPANLLEKTVRELDAYRRMGWLVPGTWTGEDGKIYQNAGFLTIITYERLALARQKGYLSGNRFDLIICDEAHKASNTGAAITKRLSEYLDHPGVECRFVALTGTAYRNKLGQVAHLSRWALRGGSPLPLDWTDLQSWSCAVDPPSFRGPPIAKPGPLIEFILPEDRETDYLDPTDLIRVGLGRRCAETPGWITSKTNDFGGSLEIRSEVVPMPKSAQWFAMAKAALRPDGLDCIDPKDQWKLIEQLSQGFFYRYNPEPPDWWKTPRKAWSSYARDFLIRGQELDGQKIDSLGHLKDRILRGQHPCPELDDWLQVEGYKPSQEPVWLDDTMIQRAAAWLSDAKDLKKHGGIFWAHEVEFGKRLSKDTGVPYYGEEGRTEDGKSILDHDGGLPMIASISANGTGLNLQHHHWRNASCHVVTSCRKFEQLVGRTHRHGQTSPVVTWEIFVGHPQQARNFWKLIYESRVASKMATELKVTRATVDFVEESAVPEPVAEVKAPYPPAPAKSTDPAPPRRHNIRAEALAGLPSVWRQEPVEGYEESEIILEEDKTLLPVVL